MGSVELFFNFRGPSVVVNPVTPRLSLVKDSHSVGFRVVGF